MPIDYTSSAILLEKVDEGHQQIPTFPIPNKKKRKASKEKQNKMKKKQEKNMNKRRERERKKGMDGRTREAKSQITWKSWKNIKKKSSSYLVCSLYRCWAPLSLSYVQRDRSSQASPGELRQNLHRWSSSTNFHVSNIKDIFYCYL